ncbi:hypothetical protein Q5530_23475 [Saccharothrix sp. BKS2]|uniref:hypothetical protein n=1 Tax=Saccharothrix sp. BKS2 TaxID=3064400 RepID=UPI0039E7DACC
MSGSSRLERRYRALLRVLPGWYRAEREEEMVGLFLADRDDELDLEHSWPGWGEAGATAALALRVRLGARRPAGGLVRLVGMTGLLAQLVMVGQVWAAVARSGVPPQAWWADVPVVVAFAALVAGHRALGRAAGAVTGLLAVLPWVHSALSGAPWWFTAVFALPVWVTAVAVVAGFHAEAPRPGPRWWAAAVAGVAAGAVVSLVGAVAVWLSWLTFLWAWVVAAALVAVVRPWRAASRPAAPDPA